MKLKPKTQPKQSEISLKSEKFLYEQTYYVKNLEIIKNEAQPHNWDCLAIFHGFEGSGKSTLMFQTAKWFDKDFSLEQVVFTPQQFNKAIDEAKIGSAIVWDEAITGADAESHAKTINKTVISKLTQIRKKKLIFLLGFPYLYMLSKYYISRCLFSCYVYAKDFDDRGYFSFHDFRRTNVLYWFMKEVRPYFPMSAIKDVAPNFPGTFNGRMPINSEEYDAKKESARVFSGEKTYKEQRAEYVLRARELSHITQADLAHIFNVSRNTICKDIKDFKDTEFA